MSDIASLLAEAFTEMDADTVDTIDPPIPTSPTVGRTPAAGSAFASNYAPAMLNIIRFLASVQKTPSNDATKTAFTTAWSQTLPPSSVAEITSEMQHVYALPVAHLTAVFGGLTDEQRRFFHAQCLQLSDGVKVDMPELSLAAALLRWLMQAALPAVQGFPEESSLNTTAVLRKNYTSLDYASRVARPDDSNPDIQKLLNRVSGLEKQLAEKMSSSAPNKNSTTLAKVDGTSAIATGTAPCPKSYKQMAILFGVLAIVAVVLLFILGILYSRKANAVAASTTFPAPAVPVSLGGVRGGKQALDMGIGGSTDVINHGIWGFTDLV